MSNRRKWGHEDDPFIKEDKLKEIEAPKKVVDEYIAKLEQTRAGGLEKAGFQVEHQKREYEKTIEQAHNQFKKGFMFWLAGRQQTTTPAEVDKNLDRIKKTYIPEVKRYLCDPIERKKNFVKKIVELHIRGEAGLKTIRDCYIYYKYLIQNRTNIDEYDYMSEYFDDDNDKEDKINLPDVDYLDKEYNKLYERDGGNGNKMRKPK